MSSQNIHPAILELRRFLHGRGDVIASAFMQKWLTAWMDVFAGTVEVPSTVQAEAPSKSEFTQKVNAAGFQALGIVMGPQCAEIEETFGDEKTRYQFTVLAFRSKKRLVLDG